MFGNKENDGFLDGLARSIAGFAAIFFIFYFLIAAITLLIVAIRNSPIKVLMWSIILFIVFHFFSHITEQDKKQRALKHKSIEDTRSGQEIWKENMKDYDTERGW